MQIFRKKYLYNSEKPVFSSETVKTFQCMNTQTKDQRFLLLHHLVQPQQIDPSPSVLQPVQFSSTIQPFSVYPFVECCSNIKKLSQADGMYIIKSLVQGSNRIKKPLYLIISPQGICVSQVQGLLPQKSPSLFQIALSILDIPQSLVQVQKSPISLDAIQILKAIKDGDNPSSLLSKYGWKDIKKDKSTPFDNQYWIFRGRRKQQGPFSNDQYGLAWSSQFNICRFKHIDLTKDGYEEQFYEQFKKKVETFKTAGTLKLDILLEIYKFQKDSKGIKIFSQIPNQGPLGDYIMTKYAQGRPLTQKSMINMLQAFVQQMIKMRESSAFKSFGTLHLKNVYLHSGQLVIGDPLLISDKVQKKMRQLKNGMDYYAPELKQNILLVENLMKLNFEKMDIWFFGFMLHKIICREVPIFDSTRKPILNGSNNAGKMSPGMMDLITRCLSLTPANRPSWTDINLRELEKKTYVQDLSNNDIEDNLQSQTKQIKLGTRKERISSRQSGVRPTKIDNQLNDNASSNKKFMSRQQSVVEQEKLQLKDQQPIPQQKQQQIVLPMHPKFRRFKLILKIILVIILYVFVYFLPFLTGSVDMLMVRGYYTTASVHLTSKSGDIVSTATVLTNTPEYFMLNDITFDKLYTQLHCIDNNFNPIHDPSYQLNSFIQSSSFLTLILLGWISFLIILATKSIQIWKGGIGNQNQTSKNKQKYWIAYGFYQLSMAALLFAHFYIFQFFYFSIAEPCLGIYTFEGIEPFFDSSLYIFLGNTQDYFRTVFACLGILGIIILFSSCFYSWGPKLDTKHFLSVFSIIFRVLPYVLFILLSRIGIFLVLNPTALNDQNKIITSLVSESFTGFLGIIPQVFIVIVITFEILYELLLNLLYSKIMASNKLQRWFGLKKSKNQQQNQSKLSRNNSMDSKMYDMSLQNSKNQLILDQD